MPPKKQPCASEKATDSDSQLQPSPSGSVSTCQPNHSETDRDSEELGKSVSDSVQQHPSSWVSVTVTATLMAWE